MFNFSLRSLKERVNLKFCLFFIAWSVLIFFIGSQAGIKIPTDYQVSLENYAINLEKENSRLNKSIKSCKKHTRVIELDRSENKY